MKNFKHQSVNVHKFSMIPQADVPRSKYLMPKMLKTTFDAGYLIPIMCEEVLPGDTWNTRMTAFVGWLRLFFPVMDNLHLETFFFFVPMRLVWVNSKKFFGEQDVPTDSISYIIPQVVSPAGGYPVGSIFDMFGLPTVGQVGGAATVSHSCLPLRGWQRIYNEWFRDENLQSPYTTSTGDGPDNQNVFFLVRRGKRHDYFTSCLPWTQKGGVAVSLPLGTSATVMTSASNLVNSAQPAMTVRIAATGAGVPAASFLGAGADAITASYGGATFAPVGGFYPANLYADLSSATASTVNQLRLSVAIQKMLEKDARGGTRYTEKIRLHFGVTSPDARLQRTEYLGGGRSAILYHPVAQTSASDTQPTPQGNLAATATSVASNHGFSQSFTEHGYIIGVANVFADLTYQQGLRKLWSRSTQYDFYWPTFANLGEQAVLNKEIYCDGSANDELTFGYQERWAELRHNPSQICGLFKSTSAGTIDPWHLAQHFTALPTLNATFIEETPPVARTTAVGAAANGQQMLMDAYFENRVSRPIPMHSVPGMMDRF